MIMLALFVGLWLNEFTCQGFFLFAAIIADCVWMSKAAEAITKRK